MKKLYCDRCKQEVSSLHEISIPDKHCSSSRGCYITKKVEVCTECKKTIEHLEGRFNDAMVDLRLAFYKTLFEK